MISSVGVFWCLTCVDDRRSLKSSALCRGVHASMLHSHTPLLRCFVLVCLSHPTLYRVLLQHPSSTTAVVAETHFDFRRPRGRHRALLICIPRIPKSKSNAPCTKTYIHTYCGLFNRGWMVAQLWLTIDDRRETLEPLFRPSRKMFLVFSGARERLCDRSASKT